METGLLECEGREAVRAVRNAEKMRVELKFGSWNVKSLVMRAIDVDSLIAHEELDCFSCARRSRDGGIPELFYY